MRNVWIVVLVRAAVQDDAHLMNTTHGRGNICPDKSIQVHRSRCSNHSNESEVGEEKQEETKILK